MNSIFILVIFYLILILFIILLYLNNRSLKTKNAFILKNLEQEKNTHIILETQLIEAEKRLAEQKIFFEQEKNKLSESFGLLSKEALNTNNQIFLDLAKTTFEKLLIEMKGDLSKKEDSISNLFKPLTEVMSKYDQEMRRLEENRQKAYGSLENYLGSLVESNQKLQKETNNLVMALKSPQVRGRWGEITLKRVVELAGLTEHIDFTEQHTVENDENHLLRPDMIINLPNNRTIVVDSKVSLQAYLEAIASNDEQDRLNHFKRHAAQIMDHMKKLGKKAYWDQFVNTPEFVVMFIPGESFFSVAVDFEKSLIEEGIQNKVILATPTTLIALLKAIAYGWRQEQLNSNALAIQNLGSSLYDRLIIFIENFSKIGKSLDNAVENYNKSVGSLETRVLVSARKFKELGSTSKDLPQEVNQIEKITRVIVE
ncbi:MAG: DNA recombination protein RmuC [Candidatus Margulisiibacteriota bacterium]|jgi:DNA recombination protein RmuC